MKVDIIGTGKVGRHLYQRMKSLRDKSGIDARLVNSRTLDGLRPDTDIALLTVSDSAIRDVASRIRSMPAVTSPRFESGDALPSLSVPPRSATGHRGVLAHVSGSTPMEVLGDGPVGVFYPFQSFAEGVEVDFTNVPFMIEGCTSEVRDILFRLAKKLGSPAYYCDGERRRELHLCGVVACNFVNELIGIAQERLEGVGLLPGLIAPLVRKTVDKALDKGAANVRTGPAVRGDRETMEAHERMLAHTPDIQELYRRLSQLIISRSQKD